jgi:hypothetical protein
VGRAAKKNSRPTKRPGGLHLLAFILHPTAALVNSSLMRMNSFF